MSNIRIDEGLWASRMAPEGIVERWFVADGAVVTRGERVVEVRIEDALHEIATPASGRLMIIADRNAIIEPGSVLGKVNWYRASTAR
jgi:pyruvate/2-oxoglutarate dehydrogenase complex dihydrolipoamide acyltransferase (E2) component